VALHVPAVLQAQRPEFVLGKLAGLPAFELVSELRRALVHELAVEVCVLVHRVFLLLEGVRPRPRQREPGL
jgi:hypothetical protein